MLKGKSLRVEDSPFFSHFTSNVSRTFSRCLQKLLTTLSVIILVLISNSQQRSQSNFSKIKQTHGYSAQKILLVFHFLCITLCCYHNVDAKCKSCESSERKEKSYTESFQCLLEYIYHYEWMFLEI